MLFSTIKDHAQDNYLKNRGEPDKWFQHKADYIEDKPVPRIKYGAFDIVEKNKPIMGELLVSDYKTSYRDDIHVRLTTAESKKIADKFNFQEDKWFDFPGNMNYKPPKAPRKLHTETGQEIAANIWHNDSHDWYKHNRPNSSVEPFKANKCIGTDAIEIKTKMQSSNASDWFRTWSNKDKRTSHTAPNSPKSRVKPEGYENAIRAQGVGLELTRHSTHFDREYDDCALPYRCVTTEAGDNCRSQSRGRAMSRCLGGSSNRSASSSRAQDRVKDDQAREYLSRGRSGTMHLAVEGNSVEMKPKVRPEAEEYYLKSQRDLGKVLHQYNNKGYSSPKPAQRIRTDEARMAAEVNKGVMDSFLKNPEYRSAIYPSKFQVRAAVGPDAEEIVQKSVGSSMKQILEAYGKKHQSSQRKLKKTFVSDDYDEKPSGVAEVLVHSNKRIQPDIPPLRISGDGFDNLEKHRGTDFFKTIQQKPPTK